MKNQADRTKGSLRISGHTVLSFFAAFLMVLVVWAVPAQPSVVSAAPPVPKRGPHIMPFRPRGTSVQNAIAPAGAHLVYNGGPVISNMKSIDVSYGTGTYLSNNSTALTGFTTQLLGSGLLDWLLEYNTNLSGGTNQLIGRGTANGVYAITPSSANNGSSITDAQIQSELIAQIAAGYLPAPDANTSYALFFRLGQQICSGGSCSLVAGGFCAYHSTFTAPNNVVATYQVMPDLTSTTGCGNSTDFGNTTSVLSHELVETITDPQVGFATTNAPPLAWYDNTYGEISDICNAIQGTFTGTNNTTYVAQLQFSNLANDCIMTRAVSADFSISASPASLTIPNGASGSSTISTATANGLPGTVSLAVSGAPAGVTASLSPSSVSAGASSSLSLSVDPSATPGTYPLTVTGTEGSSTHATTISLTIPANDFSISAAPASLTVAPGTSGSSSISTAVTGGAAGTVSLSVSGTPAGVTVSLSPSLVSAGASATLTVNASPSAASGNYILTISGVEGSNTHSTQVTVTISDTTRPTLYLPTAITVNATGPSGASVSYTVTASDPDNAAAQLTIACVPASGSVFAIGTTTVNCSASDPSGNTSTGSFSITVKGAAAQVQDLINLVKSFHLSSNLQTNLLNKLNDVQMAITAGQVATAVSDLSDFITKVNNSVGKSLTSAQANQLVQAAKQIEAVLGQ